MKDKKVINICLCTKDDYYIKYVASLLASLSNYKNKDYSYNIYILWWEFSKNTQNSLNEIDKDFCIKYISFNEISVFEKYSNVPKKDYIYLYRLFIWDYIKEVDKIIYMDSDIIINWDISELFNINLWDNIVWAAHDCINWSQYSKEKLIHYFNSWVLLIDLNKWNKENIWHRVLQVLNDRKNEFALWQDQCGLNYVLDRQRKLISPKWNWINMSTFTNKGTQYTKKEFHELRHPTIVHYAWWQHRPWWWFLCVHPKRYLYYKYIFRTKFWDISDVCKFPLKILTSNFIIRFLYKLARLLFHKW